MSVANTVKDFEELEDRSNREHWVLFVLSPYLNNYPLPLNYCPFKSIFVEKPFIVGNLLESPL
jgi:hypothetical protein